MADMQLDIHPASDAERLAAYRNVHDVWSGGLPMEEHLLRRVASVQHNRAEWYVGCLNGEVVSSLACYPMTFRLCGRSAPGMAIGSVHTRAEFRGRGFAPRLITWVEELKRQSGIEISLLYSDIDPAYYARLGYLRCPSHEGWSSPASGMIPDAIIRSRLESFAAEESLDVISDMYNNDHGQRAISIERSVEYWQHILRKHPSDEFFFLRDEAGKRQAYVRMACDRERWKIADWAFSGRDEALHIQLYIHLLRVARERGLSAVGGWLPDCDPTRALFEVQPRKKEITMLKPLGSISLDDNIMTAAGWFCEVDHV